MIVIVSGCDYVFEFVNLVYFDFVGWCEVVGKWVCDVLFEFDE